MSIDSMNHLISNAEMQQFRLLKKILLHSNPERFPNAYFICGEGGDVNASGLPESILICPSLGSEITVVYRRVDTAT